MPIAFKIGASLKTGTPNYSSVGTWLEFDVTVDDPEIDTERLIAAVKQYQQFADQMVQLEQARKEARYPHPVDHTESAQSGPAAPPPASYPQPQPARAAPAPRNGGPPARPAPQRGGGGGKRWGGGSGGGGGKNGPPQDGKQLLGWASNHGYRKALFQLGEQYEAEYGRINSWDKAMCDWAVGQLEAGPVDEGQEGPAY